MNADELRIQRTFDAPREDVFDAWTSPEVMRRWLAAGDDWSTPHAKVDLRPGGTVTVTMAEAGGEPAHTFRGEYLEVSPPERGLATDESRDDHEDGWTKCLANLEARLLAPGATT